VLETVVERVLSPARARLIVWVIAIVEVNVVRCEISVEMKEAIVAFEAKLLRLARALETVWVTVTDMVSAFRLFKALASV